VTELEKLKISNFQAGILREIGVGGEVVESSTPHFLNGASSIVIVKIFNRLSSQTSTFSRADHDKCSLIVV